MRWRHHRHWLLSTLLEHHETFCGHLRVLFRDNNISAHPREYFTCMYAGGRPVYRIRTSGLAHLMNCSHADVVALVENMGFEYARERTYANQNVYDYFYTMR
jgi:hypothetical protein